MVVLACVVIAIILLIAIENIEKKEEINKHKHLIEEKNIFFLRFLRT